MIREARILSALSAELPAETCGVTLSASAFSEELFDLVIYREAAALGFREDYLAIDDDVELTCFTGLDLDLLTKAGTE